MFSAIVNKYKTPLITALIVLPFLIYGVVMATQESSWDNWGFGSAQTMLTVRYWERDG